MSNKLIIVNADNVNTDSGSCTSCGEEFRNNDFVVIWKDCKHHMTCFLEIVENIDRDLGYIMSDIINPDTVKDFVEAGQNGENKISIASRHFDEIHKMFKMFYDLFEMDSRDDDAEEAI